MDIHRPRVLAIDDTPANLMVLATALSNEYTFQLATSGAMGLAMAQESTPDIVLLDVMMPEMDGYETCRRLKADPALAHVPVVFVTALSDTRAEMDGLTLGAADYLVKPVNVEVARQRIRNLLERESLRHEVEMHRDHLETLVAERTQALELANAQLSEARERAESASRVKSTFLQNMSHELFTPLNIVTGMATVLSDRLHGSELHDMSRQINHAANQLVRIIRDILQLARLEGGEDEDAIERFEPRQMLQELRLQFQTAAQAKQLQLDNQIADDVPSAVEGPSTRIKEVLRHFLSNAIKFSQRGSVSMKVTVCEPPPERATTQPDGDADTRWMQWAVIDTGIGLTDHEQHALFRAFTQADGSATRAHGGLGVGLALCKHLARMMNGELGVYSQSGVGSTFWLRVPCRVDRGRVSGGVDTPGRGRDAGATETDAAPATIAWGENEQMQLRVLVTLLRGGDAEALSVWQDLRPALDTLLGSRALPLANAMEQFDFDTALQRLEAAAADITELERV